MTYCRYCLLIEYRERGDGTTIVTHSTITFPSYAAAARAKQELQEETFEGGYGYFCTIIDRGPAK